MELETSVLFTPGRASYPDEQGTLQLTEAAMHRALTAAEVYDPNTHTKALFAGGYPGIAQNWPEAAIPPRARREAHLLAGPLSRRLANEGTPVGKIAKIVGIQGSSCESFGDVIESVETGLLDPNHFDDKHHGITLVAGKLHGFRFRGILSKALDIDPKRIKRVPIKDVYGTPEYPAVTVEGGLEYPGRPAEKKAMALAKEFAAIAVTKHVLRRVKPGDLEALKRAQEQFIAIAQKSARD